MTYLVDRGIIFPVSLRINLELYGKSKRFICTALDKSNVASNDKCIFKLFLREMKRCICRDVRSKTNAIKIAKLNWAKKYALLQAVIQVLRDNVPRKLCVNAIRARFIVLTVSTRLLVTEKNFIPVKLILSVVTCVKNLETCATFTCNFTCEHGENWFC